MRSRERRHSSTPLSFNLDYSSGRGRGTNERTNERTNELAIGNADAKSVMKPNMMTWSMYRLISSTPNGVAKKQAVASLSGEVSACDAPRNHPNHQPPGGPLVVAHYIALQYVTLYSMILYLSISPGSSESVHSPLMGASCAVGPFSAASTS